MSFQNAKSKRNISNEFDILRIKIDILWTKVDILRAKSRYVSNLPQ